jgi:hypothetical protein
MTSIQNPPLQPDILGNDDPEQSKDRAGTPERQPSFVSDDDEVDATETETSSDDSKFAPNKVYYIQPHYLSSKQITIVDITDKISVPFVDGKDVSDEFRDAAKKVGTAEDAEPIFTIRKKHWYNKSYSAFAGVDTETPLADWKHPSFSTGTATLSFPADSKHCSHNLSISPVKRTRRTNAFVNDSVPYTWKCDYKYKPNHMSLLKRIGGKNSTVARYTQKWATWGMGGVLLMDNREVDDLVVILTACSMLRRVKQRRWERHGSAGGGGG